MKSITGTKYRKALILGPRALSGSYLLGVGNFSSYELSLFLFVNFLETLSLKGSECHSLALHPLLCLAHPSVTSRYYAEEAAPHICKIFLKQSQRMA